MGSRTFVFSFNVLTSPLDIRDPKSKSNGTRGTLPPPSSPLALPPWRAIGSLVFGTLIQPTDRLPTLSAFPPFPATGLLDWIPLSSSFCLQAPPREEPDSFPSSFPPFPLFSNLGLPTPSLPILLCTSVLLFCEFFGETPNTSLFAV